MFIKKNVAVIMTLLVLVGCSSANNTDGSQKTLKVFNWGSYIEPSLVKEFEDKFNAKVVYEVFDSNESMYIKVESDPTYDVLFPTDYMIERLRLEDKLEKLDYSKIPNYKETLDTVKGRAMDPNEEYTAPYFWGSVGIVYDKTKVTLEELESQGWLIFKNPKYAHQIFFLDSERDAFMVATKSLGYSMNTTNEAELKEAYEWLVDMDKITHPIYNRDEIIDNMVAGVKPLATMYSGDATYVLAENPNLAFYLPKEGTNQWMDAMVIPKGAKNIDLAHEWINFVLDKDNQKRITEEIGYTSSRQDVIDEVTTVGGKFEGIESYSTRTNYEKDENYRFDEKTRVILADLWQRAKNHD